MKEIQVDKLLKFFNKKNLNIVEQIFIMFEINDEFSKKETKKVSYSKSFFSEYYSIDLETFKKWILIFCPKFCSEEYTRKRKFTNEEASYIYSCLGKTNFYENLPRNHKELADKIFEGKNWKKSKSYNEVKFDIEEKFGSTVIKINLLPPKLIKEILMEELEHYKDKFSDNSFQNESYEQKINSLMQIMTKENLMTEHEKEVRLRLLRRWWNKPINEDLDL